MLGNQSVYFRNFCCHRGLRRVFRWHANLNRFSDFDIGRVAGNVENGRLRTNSLDKQTSVIPIHKSARRFPRFSNRHDGRRPAHNCSLKKKAKKLLLSGKSTINSAAGQGSRDAALCDRHQGRIEARPHRNFLRRPSMHSTSSNRISRASVAISSAAGMARASGAPCPAHCAP